MKLSLCVAVLALSSLAFSEGTPSTTQLSYSYEGGWDFRSREWLNLVTVKVGTVQTLDWLSVKLFTGLSSKNGNQQFTGGGALVGTHDFKAFTASFGVGYSLFETTSKPHPVLYLGISGVLNK